jgi:hypothetical protein
VYLSIPILDTRHIPFPSDSVNRYMIDRITKRVLNLEIKKGVFTLKIIHGYVV